MAVGKYTLPICDGCKLPWLPTGWKQDSDPRDTKKPLRCGKCKSSGWDREFISGEKCAGVVQTKEAAADKAVTVAGSIPAPTTRCKHRMSTASCPICSKEPAPDA